MFGLLRAQQYKSLNVQSLGSNGQCHLFQDPHPCPSFSQFSQYDQVLVYVDVFQYIKELVLILV